MYDEAAVATKPPTNKSEFIRSFPDSYPVADVVEKARAAGLDVDAKYVGTIRYNARRNADEERKRGRSTSERRSVKAKAAKTPKASKARGAKTEFIRAASPKLTAHEVVAAAAKKGLEITTTHVYQVRGRKGEKGAPVKSGPKPSPAGDFIRRMAPTMSAQEVVAAGEKKGLKFTTSLVYQVRLRDKRGRTAPASTVLRARAKEAAAAAPHVTKKRKGHGHHHHTHDGQGGDEAAALRRIVLALGVTRTRAILDAMERRMHELLDDD